MQQLISAKSENENAVHENNRLQTKMKELNDEYKSRLNKWVEDIAVSSWSTGIGFSICHQSRVRNIIAVNVTDVTVRS